MIALGRALVARGHDVVLQTWRRWEEHVEAEGMRFAAAPEYHVFPTLERPLTPYQAVVRAVHDTRPLVAETRRGAAAAARTAQPASSATRRSCSTRSSFDHAIGVIPSVPTPASR